ncbi:LicD family [Trypanosoma brucei equiperdum]|uniref:LicD family n=1 Tax=Trypanosoma brucei equiperdum TaxID=630700 RepID=A0A3L6KWQ2_9TRYP|nr:LicD family [Trypanosoma brucei equiperdum]
MSYGWRGCRVLLGSMPSFRPHIHRHPCTICSSAVTQYQDATETTSADICDDKNIRNDIHSASHASCFNYLSSDKAATATPASLHFRDRQPSGWSGRALGATVCESRRAALNEWLGMMQNAAKTTQSQPEDAYLQQCWQAFRDPSWALTDREMEGAIELLDRQCEFQKSCTTSDKCLVGESANSFLMRLRGGNVHSVDEERQLSFQRTLLEFRDLANTIKLPFFLCCGTALAAHREGYFIPHDVDIDVGVFYEDLQDLGDPQKAVVGLLSHAALGGRFVLFDVCGTVEKGLELRFLHSETQVPIDLNVYYQPLPQDDKIVAEFGPFVWTATYYESSATRRHGMYRYRHAPFRAAMKHMSFCDTMASSSDPTNTVGFLVPPESYVEECYGKDWRTPRRFTYAEGLQNGGFANIIDE